MNDITLAEALERIPAKRAGDAYLALTLACAYLQTGRQIPTELRVWLNAYLTNERRLIGGTRTLNMANLSVYLAKAMRRASGRPVKAKLETAQFESAVGLGTGTAQSWRTKNREMYEANVALHRQLLSLLGVEKN